MTDRVIVRTRGTFQVMQLLCRLFSFEGGGEEEGGFDCRGSRIHGPLHFPAINHHLLLRFRQVDKVTISTPARIANITLTPYFSTFTTSGGVTSTPSTFTAISINIKCVEQLARASVSPHPHTHTHTHRKSSSSDLSIRFTRALKSASDLKSVSKQPYLRATLSFRWGCQDVLHSRVAEEGSG